MAIGETKLSPSDQILLGLYKAQAGNQLDGELAFLRAKAPFGNYSPKTRAEREAEFDEFYTTHEASREDPFVRTHLEHALLGALGWPHRWMAYLGALRRLFRSLQSRIKLGQ